MEGRPFSAMGGKWHSREGEYVTTDTASGTVDLENGKGAIDLASAPAKVLDLIKRLSLTATTDTAAAQLDIMATILSATSEEEIFAAANAGTISGQDHTGQPFLIRDYEAKKSAPGFISQGGFPFYYLLRVTDLQDGAEHVITCGGFTFVSVMDSLDRGGHIAKAMEEHGGYPMVLEARTMRGSGYDVLIPHRYILTPPTSQAKAAKA